MKDDVFLQRAGRIAGVGGWRVDLTTGTVEWSDQTCRILDAPLGFKPTLNYATSMYTAASRPVIEKLIQEAVAHGTPWAVALQMLTTTGRLIWTRSVGEVEIKDGRAVALAGAFQDISARKATEAERLAAVELTRTFYDNAPCGNYSLGPDRTILRIFVLVLADIDSGAELEGVLRRVLASVAEPVKLQEGSSAKVTASIGVAIFPDDSHEKGILLRKADHAMYVAKSQGKSRFVRAADNVATAADHNVG